jgi:hypothetical protein
VIHGTPSSQLEVMERVCDRIPEVRHGIESQSGHPVLWLFDTYMILTPDFFCVHSKKMMHGTFSYSNPQEVEAGLKIFFSETYR